jgi:hypothetical protein
MGSSYGLPASATCKDIKEVLESLESTNLKIVENAITSMKKATQKQQRKMSIQLKMYLEDSIDMKFICRRYLRAAPNKPLLLWIDGVIESNSANRSIAMRHSCLLVVSTEYLALFNPGVEKPKYVTKIAKPYLAREVINEIKTIKIMKDVQDQKVWYKTVDSNDSNGNFDCWKEAINLTKNLTSKDDLSRLGYTHI